MSFLQGAVYVSETSGILNYTKTNERIFTEYFKSDSSIITLMESINGL